MSVLRGNYKAKEVPLPEKKAETAEHKFEEAAMKRLGGSIAFVAKKKVVWVKPV